MSNSKRDPVGDSISPAFESAYVQGMQMDIARRREDNAHQRASREQEWGMVGKLWGSPQNGAFVVAALLAVVCVIALAVAAIFEPSYRTQLLDWLSMIGLIAFGFATGSISGLSR